MVSTKKGAAYDWALHSQERTAGNCLVEIVPSPASEPVKNTGKVDGIKAKAVPRVSQFYYYNSKGVPIVLLQFMIMRLPVRMRQRILHVVTLCAFCSVFGV